MPHQNHISAFTFLETLVRTRLKQEFKKSSIPRKSAQMELPKFHPEETSPFSQFVLGNQLAPEELVVLLLALVPYVYPHFLDALLTEYLPKGGDFPAFGGVKTDNHRATIPTGETVLYLLAGNDLERRFRLMELFGADHFFSRARILYLEEVKTGEPPMSGKLILDSDYVDLFTVGHLAIPRLSARFPAQHIHTELEWDDLVLNEQTMAQIRDLETWVEHNDTLMGEWGMYRKLKPGYRALFYGPPGTGKTLTATLLGKYTGKEVFKIDLSMVISKYIGETEKNLSNLFDKAQNKNWILFFDEADAIFGKRTGVRDAHDRYANQEVSYLLQRIEQYPGLTILASNFKNNIDEAFTRRFNSIIYFPIPKSAERLKLWQKAFPKAVRINGDINFEVLAPKYELTGSHIMNVVQYSCLKALEKNTDQICIEDIQQGIIKEYAKEGKVP